MSIYSDTYSGSTLTVHIDVHLVTTDVNSVYDMFPSIYPGAFLYIDTYTLPMYIPPFKIAIGEDGKCALCYQYTHSILSVLLDRRSAHLIEVYRPEGLCDTFPTSPKP